MFIFLHVALLIFLLTGGNGQVNSDPTLVSTKLGLVKGTSVPLPNGSSYYSFKGIPYASPPVGNLRFRDPVDPVSWSGTLDASKHRATCYGEVNPLVSSNLTSEDCLFLNVYTHSTNSSAKTPVVLWIYGGSFRVGNGDAILYGPDFLMTENIVLVTFNYRLGAFGFLTLDTAEVPGNAGLKDHVMALKWIKNNIEAFGGDPNNVVVAGESVGGSSVSALLITPLAKGLFSKAIMMSGSILADFAFVDNGKDIAYKLAQNLGSTATDDNGVLAFLRSAQPTSLVNAIRSMRAADPLSGAVIGPVAEKSFNGVSPYLTQDPWDYLENGGAIADVPIVAGVNSGDGLGFFSTFISNLTRTNAKIDLGVIRRLHINKTEDDIRDMSSAIKVFYLGKNTVTNDTALKFTNLLSDMMFIFPTHRFIDNVKKTNTNPVYLYYFSYNDDNALINKLEKGSYLSQIPLAGHSLQLGYMFNGTVSQPNPNPTELEMRKKFSRMIANFARSGNPSPDASYKVSWPQYSTNDASYLDIGEVFKVGSQFLSERMLFWDNLVDDIISNPTPTPLLV